MDVDNLDTVEITDVQSTDRDDELPDTANPETDEYFETLETYVRMAARGEQHGVLVRARPGIGKSYQIDETLSDEVASEDSKCWSYSMKSGYVSPMALYETLYEEQAEGNVLALDDVEGIANDDRAAALLKGALEGQGSGDRRIVEWDSNSSKLDEDVPERFEFNGSIVMVFNEVPDGNAHFEAVKSRCMHYAMTLTFEERMDLIHEVAKAPYEGLDYRTRMEIANWLIRHTSSDMDHVDLRSLFKCFDLYQSSVLDGEEWKLHAAEQMGIDKETIVASDIRTKTDSMVDAAQVFAEKTHHPSERFFEVLGSEAERTLVVELETDLDDPQKRIETYGELTDKSKATYYRRRDAAKDRDEL